jgi:hypothetical protein
MSAPARTWAENPDLLPVRRGIPVMATLPLAVVGGCGGGSLWTNIADPLEVPEPLETDGSAQPRGLGQLRLAAMETIRAECRTLMECDSATFARTYGTQALCESQLMYAREDRFGTLDVYDPACLEVLLAQLDCFTDNFRCSYGYGGSYRYLVREYTCYSQFDPQISEHCY